MKRVLIIFRNVVLSVIALLLLIVVLVQLTPVQNFLTRKAAAMLSKKLQTEVSVRHVRVDFFNHLLLQGVLLKDRSGDTLLYAGEARVRISDFTIFRNELPVIRYLGLHDADVHLYRTTQGPKWNYQFIVDAFNTGAKDTTKAQNEFELHLEALDLQRIRFRMDDAWTGKDQGLAIGSLQLKAKAIDLKQKKADIDRLFIGGGTFVIRDYPGAQPADTLPEGPLYPLDTTAFNPARWSIYAKSLELQGCGFFKENVGTPTLAGEFEGDHLGISGVALQTQNVRISGDTITGRIDHLAAQERSGIVIKHMEADVTVSPVLSECKNLLLQTNNSTIGDYYAMHYTRFPDFTEYIDSVRMVAHLKDAQVDMQDVAYFATPLKWMKRVARISGNFDGTVANFRTQDLNVTDGDSRLTGNLAIRGLPDMENTFFSLAKGAIFTTGPAILKWAPQLRNHPAVALELIRFAQFNGDFYGKYNAFLTSGALVSNLGTVVSNMKMTIPPYSGRTATYKGTIDLRNFQAGPLFRIPNIGAISGKLQVEGTGFDPLLAEVRVNGDLDRFDVAGYPYTNILVDGVLARKKFTGTGQVTDPNVALSFSGTVDFSASKPVLVATANLLQSNLKALGFTTDSTSVAADFDVSTTGLDPDDFTGTARIYNIDLRRNGASVDVDSLRLESSVTNDTNRRLVIASNAFLVELTGRFLLTEVPATAQQFLAGYLPNYIPPPKVLPVDQNFTYGVTTYTVDPLLAVLVPVVRGFDSSTLYGFIKTADQRLVAEANIPLGRIGPVYLKKTTILANGDYKQILMTASAKRLATDNELLNATLDMNVLLGNDSLDFSVVTQSPEAYGTARIQGSAYAHGDTLSGSLKPSEFLLNGDRWEISGTNQFAFARDHLFIRDLVIKSGTQQIAVNTTTEDAKPVLTATIQQYDLTDLREISSLESYQTSGRVNGTVKLYEPFRQTQYVMADLRATDVMLGADTIGTIAVLGQYQIASGRLTLEPESGIYRQDASLKVQGIFNTDSTRSGIDGRLTFSNTPISWAQPFAAGAVSNLGGVLNGTIVLGGTNRDLASDGVLKIKRGQGRLDATGVTYLIPAASISVTNRRIDFGNLLLFDGQGNHAEVSGAITHRAFSDMRFAVDVTTTGLEVLNLRAYENDLYYGNLTAAANISVRGTADNLQLSVMQGRPTQKGHLYLPISTASGTGSYSYVSFASHDSTKAAAVQASPMRFSLFMDIVANPLVDVSMILDPATGDAINARGNGTIRLELPSGSAARMYGNYILEGGDYTFTLRQVAFQRRFIINSGSTISFSGPIAQTQLNVEASYPTTARLYDLLDTRQVDALPESEQTDAKTRQQVNLLLRMKGSLTEPVLTFDINLPEGRSTGTVAEAELNRIRQNQRELFDQVASLLLIGTFVPTQGIVSAAAGRSVINNVSEILSSNVSGQLTNIISKITGDKQLALDLKYKNYNFSDGVSDGSTLGRNEVKLGLRRNFFNNRLIAEVGSAYDWGRPVGNASRSNFNPVGDFRLQYLLKEDGRLRLNVFRTSNYDVLINDNISRSGAGISYRRTFDNFNTFIFPWRKAKPVAVPDSGSAAATVPDSAQRVDL